MILTCVFGVVGVMMFHASALNCPDQDGTLFPFSQTSQYTAGLSKGSDIEINSATLLDVDLDVNTITVTGASAKLVFKERDTTIKTKAIMVTDYAALIIGSYDCKFQHTVNIVLQGERDIANLLHPSAREKFIATTENGAIEIHGKKKLAWTKLSQTVNRFATVNNTNNGADVKYDHRNSQYKKTKKLKKGLTLYVFDSALNVLLFNAFDFEKGSTADQQKQVTKMINNLNGVNDGDLVGISLQNYFNHSQSTDFTALWTKIETFAGMGSGELHMRTSHTFDAFAVVFVKGQTNYNQVLDKQIGKLSTVATASIDYNGWKISAESRIKKTATADSYIELRILSANVAYPDIDVLDDISSWEIGDEILLTSTDYSPYHGEVRKIKSITGKTVKLSGELFYRHYGEIENRVDMRGEVALFTRNIKIRGEMSRECPVVNGNCDKTDFDTHGGHIKIIGSFGAVFIEGAELINMGMATDKGVYPIHFHMCGNITGKTATIQENSIHNTFMRAITVHGTYGTSKDHLGVKVIRNVAYNIYGHAFFLEDGAEAATHLEANLGALIKNIDAGFTFTTDKKEATVYWITNPKVTMIGNVAAGSEGLCVWYTFPKSPVGPSASLQVYEEGEALHTPLWQFENNVLHSCDKIGMNFDVFLDDEHGNVGDSIKYDPLVDPFDPKSDPVKAQLVRMTAYKNREKNAWIRGGWFELMQYSSAESQMGVQFARGSNQQLYVKKGIILGRSQGNSEGPEYYPDAPKQTKLPFYLGHVWYEGPAFVYKTWFQGFKPDPNGAWDAGAIGFHLHDMFPQAVTSATFDVRYGFEDKAGGNRVFDDGTSANHDGSESATFIDGDGSVTQCTSSDPVPMQIVPPEKFILTAGCSYRENWQMAMCPKQFAKIKATIKSVFVGSNGDFDDNSQMKRTEYADQTKIEYEDHSGEHSPHFMVLLGAPGPYFYDFQYTNNFPKKAMFESKGVESGKSVVMGVCLPENAQLSDIAVTASLSKAVKWKTSDFELVNSFDLLKSDTLMKKLYLVGRMLYINFYNGNTRNPYWDAYDTDACQGDFCPTLTVELLTDTLTYSRCFEATAEEMNPVVDVSTLTKHDCVLPAKDPDADWGAGDTTKEHDGDWGDWGEWSYCCYIESEGPASKPSTRKKVCDNPPPSAGGADCVGNAEESKNCTLICPA